MGSVQSNRICPRCGYPGAMEDYYYKYDGVYVFCDNCGYSYSRDLKMDEKSSKLIFSCKSCGHEGIAKTKDNKLFCENCNNELTRANYVFEIKETKGYGSARINGNNGCGTVYAIPENEKERAEFLKWLEEVKSHENVQSVEINLWDGKKWIPWNKALSLEQLKQFCYSVDNDIFNVSFAPEDEDECVIKLEKLGYKDLFIPLYYRENQINELKAEVKEEIGLWKKENKNGNNSD